MKNIKSINIKGVKYKIVVSDNLEDNVVATCDKENKIITLCKQRTVKQQLGDLLHELNHAVVCETGLDQCIGPDIEEIIAENFAQFYLKFIFLKKDLTLK